MAGQNAAGPAKVPRPSADVVVIGSRGDWRDVTRRLERQTVTPARIIVETSSLGEVVPSNVLLVRPGHGAATAAADTVCFLGDLDDPAPDWLAAVTDCVAAGADLVRWGVLRLRPDGIVASVDIPPVVGKLAGRSRIGYAIRRTAAAADGRPYRGARARGLPRLLVIRRGTGDFLTTSEARPAGSLPSVSVILPVRNAAVTLGAQLAALAAQTHPEPWELIVVDNGSVDAGLAIVDRMRDRFAEVMVLPATGARSAGYARNAGVRAAHGQLLLFCDADDVADPGWVSAMVAAAGDADMVGGALDCSVLSPDFLDEQPVPLPEQPDFLPFARSANCAVWRDVLTKIGGWAEHFAGGAGEDVDLSWRAHLAGYRLVYAPAALMEYRLRPTLSGVARQKWRYGLSGAPLFRYYRHAGYRRRGWRAVLSSWLWIAWHLPDLARPGRPRRRWIRYAARLAGFAAGSLRYRVAFF